MINSIEDLRSAGVLPTGPVSAWPQSRNVAGAKMQGNHKQSSQKKKPQPKVKATMGQMAKGLAQNAMHAVKGGKVDAETRKKRYDTCLTCPAFNSDSKRCSDCGCYMVAKTWINAEADLLCPRKKWEA